MRDLTYMYFQKWIHMFLVALILLGSINWLSVGIADVNLVRLVLPLKYARWLYVVIGLAAIPLLFQRDMYLPFLGETVVPGGAMATKTPQNANDQVTIRTRPGAKVVYWAAEPNPNQGTDLPGPEKAYGEFQNSGVVVADSSGHAILRYRGTPQMYKVPMKGKLAPHVHFRIEEDSGFLGRVQTIFVKSGHVEGFADIL